MPLPVIFLPLIPCQAMEWLGRTPAAMTGTMPPHTTPLARNQARICVQPAAAAAAR